MYAGRRAVQPLSRIGTAEGSQTAEFGRILRRAVENEKRAVPSALGILDFLGTPRTTEMEKKEDSGGGTRRFYEHS